MSQPALDAVRDDERGAVPGWTPALVEGTAAVADAPAAPWRRRFAGQLAWNAASEATARGASLWLSFVCARLLPIEGFGRFAFAIALAQYVWLAGDAVANGGYAAREIARTRTSSPREAAGLTGLFARARLLAALVLTLAAAAMLAWLPLPVDNRRALAGAALFFAAYASFPDWALRGREDFRGMALAQCASAATILAGTALLLPAHPDPMLAAAVWALSSAAAALVAWPRLLAQRAVARPLPNQRWREHARRSGMFSFGAVLGIGVAQAPLLLIGMIGAPLQTGLFGAAYRLVVAVLGLFPVLWWPLFPILARSRPESPAFRDAVASVGAVALLLALPAALAFGLHAHDLLALAFGARYTAAAPALRWVAAGVPFFACAALLEQACLAIGGERVRARVQGTSLAVMIGLGAILVPRFGAEGAALTALAGFVVSFGSYALALRGIMPWTALARRARVPLLLNVGLAGAWLALAAAGVPALPSLAVAGIVYGCLAFAHVRRAAAHA